MPACIICHLDILAGEDDSEECPNGHPVHSDCLQQWLIHSKSCPLCSTDYNLTIINKYKSFVDEDARVKQEAVAEKQRQETLAKIEGVAEKIVFLKFVEYIEDLNENQQYDMALERIEPFSSNNLTDFKAKKALFLKGKINYLKGRFDLAINHLFRLVKEDFEYPDGFLYLGRAYEQLGLPDKARWAYERVK